MRSEIKLTGRRKIPISAVSVQVIDGSPQKAVFSIRQRYHFNKMPRSSVVKLRFSENNMSQTIRLGQLSDLEGIELTKFLDHTVSRPSCQVRVVNMKPPNKGILLGWTRRWTIDSDKGTEEANTNDGILKFATRATSPRTWILEFPETDYPTVYLDQSLPNPKSWARNNPVFVSFVLPAVVREVLDYILQAPEYQDVKWMVDWMKWARGLVQIDPPAIGAEYEDRARWISEVIATFSLKHDVLKKFLKSLG